ncbi:unnamed protein product [Darwinula stevensoni]|uniref:Platelet-derived growth factor (PDGF) family profile domain-containing protein n=1 Tax=Darwinula stevensoni TaxID=69355 RepID=A0A7R8X5P0_9CRUS|nr:unnamed protein product [Darwinula stevensoni]CAG0884890.1 unnamed protein product [Darwinula stevensoni]
MVNGVHSARHSGEVGGMGGGGVTFARSAPCQPEDKTVKLPLPNDPGVIFVPECTRIPQCGGCCQHDLLSCLPTRTEPLHFHDCGKNQIFRDCVCECVNLQEQRDCQRLSYKIWDHKDCSCKCLHEVPCSTGQYFDPIICRCKSYPDTTHYWQKGNVGWGYTGEGTTTTTTTSRSNLNWSDSGPRYGTDGRAYMGPSTYPRRDERRNSDRGNPAGGSHESTSPPHHMERRDETNEKGRIQKNIFGVHSNNAEKTQVSDVATLHANKEPWISTPSSLSVAMHHLSESDLSHGSQALLASLSAVAICNLKLRLDCVSSIERNLR